MNKNRTKLNATIKEIVNADDKYQAKNAMKKLAHLLGMKSLTDADRKKALLTMRQHMREEILTHAEAHIIANPTLYPGYSKVLLEEIKTLKESYNAPEATQSDIERYYDLPGLDSIEKKTGKSIRDFFTYVYSFFADNGMRDEGKKYARFLSEQEVITLYISVFSSQAGISWRQAYVLIAFMAADMALIDGFPIDTFYFNGMYIETVTPWNIPSETNLKNMRLKLRVLFNAFNYMNSQAFNIFVNELKINLFTAVIEDYIDALGGKEALPTDISYLLECLDEVIQPLKESTGDAESTEVDSIELTTALEMLNCLCTHRDIEFLKNDWFEFKTSLTSPIFGSILRMRAHQAVAMHILGYLLERVDVSTVAKCKIRLYLALTLSPGIALLGDHILRWIVGEVTEK